MRRRGTVVTLIVAVAAAAALFLVAPVVSPRLKLALGLAGILVGPAPTDPELKWDLAAGQAVPTPTAQVYPTGEQFHYVTARAGGRDVDIVLPGGRRARYLGVSGIIRGTAQSVRTIVLRFPTMDWAAARMRANALMLEWEILGVAKLDEWDRQGLGQTEPGSTRNHRWQSDPGRGWPHAVVYIEGSSNARGRPHWMVELRIVFDPPAPVGGASDPPGE